MFTTHRGSTTTFWAQDAAVFVTAYHSGDHQSSWLDYLDGLQATYDSWGVGHIVDRARLAAEGCSLFWLIHDLEGRCLGGLRVEGPFALLGRYAGPAEMAASPDADRLATELADLVEEGAVEFKGSWAASGTRGLGRVLGRCMQHSLWWLGVERGFCTGADHVQASWESVGARLLPSIRPAVYPTPEYRTSIMVWDEGHEDRIDDQQARHLTLERRYLAPLRARLLGDHDATDWQPELLFDFDPRLDELEAAGVRLVDQLNASRRELDDVLPPVGTDFHGEPSHWVHLPWRNVALHLPGPTAFRRLRTDRNRHKLRPEQLAVMSRRTVSVVGMSVGASAAFTIAQEGLCGALRLADYDRLEITNLNRLSASIADLGTPKVHIAARRLAELDPYLPVEAVDQGVAADNVDAFVAGADAVVEECDSLDVKVLVREAARRHGVPVIMETSDRGLVDVERFDVEPERAPFHGLLDGVDSAELAGLSTDDKVPYVLAILEADELSAPMAASMVEIDATTRSWPQLASDVALGSSLVASAVRRLFTEPERLPSGRARIDLGATLDDLSEPTTDRAVLEVEPAALEHPLLPERFTDAVVAAATLAPSGGNMQPWRFEFTPTSFQVAEAARTEVGMDIGGRGTAVACGAALANAMAVAAVRHRLSHRTDALDLDLDVDQPDVVGRVHLGNEGDEGWAVLAPYIPQRASNRMAGPPVPLSPEVVETLAAAAELGGGRARYLPTHELGDLVELWGEADRVRLLTPRLHREMMGELRRPGIDDVDEGLDERTMEFTLSDQAKLGILRRSDVMAELSDRDLGYRLGDDTRKKLRQSSGMVIVTVDGDTRADYVRGGVALQRLWLTATRLSLWLQPMTPVFSYARTVEELAAVVGEERGERLFRLSRLAFGQIGIGDSESFVLAARVHGGLPPSAVSARRRSPVRVTPVAGRSSGEYLPV